MLYFILCFVFQDIAFQIPDVHGRDYEDIKYTGLIWQFHLLPCVFSCLVCVFNFWVIVSTDIASISGSIVNQLSFWFQPNRISIFFQTALVIFSIWSDHWLFITYVLLFLLNFRFGCYKIFCSKSQRKYEAIQGAISTFKLHADISTAWSTWVQ